MRKVLCSLVVLAILVGMFVCLGVQGLADDEPEVAVFAVSGAELSVDSIGAMRTQAPDCLIVDVDGLTEEQAGTGYSVVWRDEQPEIMMDVAYIWPGAAQMFYVGPDSELVLLVGVAADSLVEDITSSINAYQEDDPYVIAIGPSEAAAVVAQCGEAVDMFMTYGLEDEAASETASTLGAIKLENVGSDEEAPVCHVVLKEDHQVEAEAIAVPDGSGVTDPGLGLGGPVVSVPSEEPEPVMHTITFEGGGAQGSMDPVSIEEGTMWFFPNVSIEGVGFTNEGYNFTGWSLNGDNLNHQPGDDVTISGDITVTAQWELIPVENVTITYVAGEGLGAQIDENYAPGAQITLQPWPADYSREGFNMTGWNIGGVHYDVSSSYTIQESVTATAEWTAIPVETKNATVTFNAGEAAGQPGNEDVTQTVTDIGDGVQFGLPECTFTFEGHKFTGWKANDGSDTLYTPAVGQAVEYHLTGDVTFTAQWETVQQDGPVTFTVTYASGAENASGVMDPVQVTANETHALLANGFGVEGQNFTGWSVNGDNANHQPGEMITVSDNVTVTAQWAPVPPMTFTVTYKANGGVGEDVVLPSQAKDAIITLQASSFTAPNGQKFSGWTVEGGDGTKFAAGSEYTVTGDVAFLAVWEPLTEQDAGATTTDMLTFIQNGTDGPTLSFTNAKIATVTFDSTQLTENVQYVLADEGKTLKLEPSYLNSQAIGTHVLTVTFQPGENGMTYGEVTRNVQISAEEKEQSNAPLMITSNWDRSSNWVHTFSAAPESGTFEIYYGKDATTGEPVYQTAKQGSDYDINGNTLTLYPDMVNGNWSTEWPNGSYQFKVDLNDNTTPTLQLTISGEAPAAPVQSSAPAQNTQNGAPVTGDDTPLVLYIVIMVVLIVALAVVLIIVIKRRNTGSGAGRH